MELHRIFTIALTALAAIPTMAQDRNNEDEVVKVDARFSAYNYREGEVIVKFKDQSAAQINAAPSRIISLFFSENLMMLLINSIISCPPAS